MRTAYGSFGEDTQPPPFPQPPLPGNDATSDIPTTAEVGMVSVGPTSPSPVTPPPSRPLLPLDPFAPPAAAAPVSAGLPPWILPAALAAGIVGAIVLGKRR